MRHESASYSSLAFLGVSHAVVDAVCALIVFSGQAMHLIPDRDFVPLVILYNVVAFALQAPLGLLIDRWQRPRLAACLSLLLLALAPGGLARFPMPAVVLAALANAVFHVGGGTLSFRFSPGRAAAPGIYVAPGGIGLVAGILLGRSGALSPLMAVPVLILLAVVTLAIRFPKVDYRRSEPVPSRHFEAVLLLILLCIVVRSMTGAIADFPWATASGLMVLSVAAAAGKALGGILADRLGWIRVPVSGLLVSAPILAFGRDYPALAVAGMLLFQMTMPVTLAALYRMLPGRPGFAFGLTCLALMVGLLPVYMPAPAFLQSDWALLTTVVVSAGALLIGLRLFFRGIGWNAAGAADVELIQPESPSRVG